MLDMGGTTGQRVPEWIKRERGENSWVPPLIFHRLTGPLRMLPRHHGLDGLEP